MIRLWVKLKAAKASLVQWNKDIFGNLFDSKKQAESEVEHSQAAFDIDPSPHNREILHAANAALRQALHREELYWHQKSRTDWIDNGDRNTEFYHAVTQQNRRRNFMKRLRISSSEEWCEDQHLLQLHAVSFYQHLFSSEDHNVASSLLDNIPHLVTDAQNSALCGIPDAQEIRNAVWNLKGSSAPGPDGFSGDFYTATWDIIGPDVIDAVQAFFRGFPLPKGISSSLITLIPKVHEPCSLNDFRPISLCNFSYKIISKVLADRLAPILPGLVSIEQGAFVKGRFILDNVALARQLMVDIDRKVTGHKVYH